MKREDIDNLIVYLLAIANYAKDIHYNCSGPNFYGNHLFADTFVEDIYKHIDDLKEICLLGHGFQPLDAADYLQDVITVIPKGVYDFRIMRDLMIEAITVLNKIDNTWEGDADLLGNIGKNIQHKVGLINIMFGNARE